MCLNQNQPFKSTFKGLPRRNRRQAHVVFRTRGGRISKGVRSTASTAKSTERSQQSAPHRRAAHMPIVAVQNITVEIKIIFKMQIPCASALNASRAPKATALGQENETLCVCRVRAQH